MILQRSAAHSAAHAAAKRAAETHMSLRASDRRPHGGHRALRRFVQAAPQRGKQAAGSLQPVAGRVGGSSRRAASGRTCVPAVERAIGPVSESESQSERARELADPNTAKRFAEGPDSADGQDVQDVYGSPACQDSLRPGLEAVRGSEGEMVSCPTFRPAATLWFSLSGGRRCTVHRLAARPLTGCHRSIIAMSMFLGCICVRGLGRGHVFAPGSVLSPCLLGISGR